MSLSQSGMLGILLKQFRLAAALSQEELAAKSGVSARAISDIERGQRTTARFETVRLLAGALELSVQDRDLLMEAAQSESRDDARSPDTDDSSQVVPGHPVGGLPIQPTPLIGREAVLAGVRSTIARNPGRLVTLTGPGGVGKTRLAIEAASQMAPAFEDVVAFVSLAPVSDPELVPAAIAQALGIPVTATSLLEWVADYLRSRQLLLVLDNFEHIVEAAPDISVLMAAAPRLSVLVTSRVRLHLSAELEYPVPALDLPAPEDPLAHLQANESVRLFSDRARAIDPGFTLTEDNAAVIAHICRRLDGLPLGIELVAPRLKMLPVTEVLRRLDHQLPLLAGGSRDMPERQQSMRSSIAWSYNLLGPGEQQLLRWMSVFVGGFSLEAAEAAGIEIGVSSAEVFESVYSLVDNALVQSVPDPDSRFRMLEPIREFGLEQLASSGELDAARMFHALHFLAFAARDAPTPTEPEPPAWVRRLAEEQDNLMATFDHLCDPATSELCLQFAVAYGPWLALSGPIQESWLRLRRAIEIASPEPNITRAHALFWASNLAMYAGETESATALCQEAINVADHLNDPIAKAAAIHSRAWHEEMQENWETASQLFEQALVTWEETDNAFMQAQALMLLGGHAYVKDDLAVARSREEKAAALFEQTAGPDWRAGPHWYLGFIAVAEGRIADAAESYELSLNIWLESESPTPSCFKALVHLADIAVRVGLFEGAARMLGAAGKVMHDTGAVLFPFDEPASERAEEASREALGVAQFYEYRDAGWRSSPDDWLREARVIVSAAQNTTENSGTSETASEWSPSHPASAKQGV